jgi:hypothetical protein
VRDRKGRFQSGGAGSGTPPADAHVSEHAKPHTAAAIGVLVSIMMDATGNPYNSSRVRAAEAVLNRAWGRPPEDHTVRVSGVPEQLKLDLTDDQLSAIADRGL